MTQSSRWVCRACARVYPTAAWRWWFYAFFHNHILFIQWTVIRSISLCNQNQCDCAVLRKYWRKTIWNFKFCFFLWDWLIHIAACCHIFVFSYVLYVCVRSINDFNEPTTWCSWNVCCLLHERRTAARGGMHTMKTNLCITNKRTHRRYIY